MMRSFKNKLGLSYTLFLKYPFLIATSVFLINLGFCKLGYGETHFFSIKTHDGTTDLNGQIDFPDHATSASFPLVVMVPGGGGFFDRDYCLDVGQKDEDCLFLNLSKSINEIGIATLRFDWRGFSKNRDYSYTKPPLTHDEIVQMFTSRFQIDMEIRSRIVPENMRSDIQQIFDYASQHVKVDSSQIIALGHSEGTFHLSHLIGTNAIHPKGLMMLGMIGRSMKDLSYWKRIPYAAEALFSGVSENERLSDKDVQEKCLSDMFIAAHVSCKDLVSDFGFWKKDSLIRKLEKLYQNFVDEFRGRDDLSLYAVASARWYKMYLFDESSPTKNLLNFDGRIFFHNGDVDLQTPGVHEFDAIKALLPNFLRQPKLRLHPGIGHSLGKGSSLSSVIAPEVKASILEDLREIVDWDHKTHRTDK